MLMLAIAAVVIASVPVFGGKLGRLAALRLRGAWLVAAALVVQVLIISVVPDVPHAVAGVLHIATYAAAAVVVWLNRMHFGVVLLGVGAGLNGLAITVNGGTLPASTAASGAESVTDHHHHFVNSAHLGDAHLRFLGDVWATPSWVPLHNVFSVGDVVILAGAAVLVHAACETRPYHAVRRVFARRVARRRDARAGAAQPCAARQAATDQIGFDATVAPSRTATRMPGVVAKSS
jgi:hypothetical protein